MGAERENEKEKYIYIDRLEQYIYEIYIYLIIFIEFVSGGRSEREERGGGEFETSLV